MFRRAKEAGEERIFLGGNFSVDADADDPWNDLCQHWSKRRRQCQRSLSACHVCGQKRASEGKNKSMVISISMQTEIHILSQDTMLSDRVR